MGDLQSAACKRVLIRGFAPPKSVNASVMSGRSSGRASGRKVGSSSERKRSRSSERAASVKRTPAKKITKASGALAIVKLARRAAAEGSVPKLDAALNHLFVLAPEKMTGGFYWKVVAAAIAPKRDNTAIVAHVMDVVEGGKYDSNDSLVAEYFWEGSDHNHIILYAIEWRNAELVDRVFTQRQDVSGEPIPWDYVKSSMPDVRSRDPADEAFLKLMEDIWDADARSDSDDDDDEEEKEEEEEEEEEEEGERSGDDEYENEWR